MKKALILGGVALIATLGILFYFVTLDRPELSQEEILEVIKPEIQSYCQDLDDAAMDSHCTICGGVYSGELEHQNYLYVESFDEGQRERYKYMIEEDGKNYLVTSKIHRIAGQNNRPSSPVELTFEIDRDGNIVEKDIPEVSECFS